MLASFQVTGINLANSHICSQGSIGQLASICSKDRNDTSAQESLGQQSTAHVRCEVQLGPSSRALPVTDRKSNHCSTTTASEPCAACQWLVPRPDKTRVPSTSRAPPAFAAHSVGVGARDTRRKTAYSDGPGGIRAVCARWLATGDAFARLCRMGAATAADILHLPGAQDRPGGTHRLLVAAAGRGTGNAHTTARTTTSTSRRTTK